MNQAAYLKIFRLAKKTSGMANLVYEGEDGKTISTVLYLAKYPETDTAKKAQEILVSKGQKVADFLDKVSVGDGYILVTLGKVVFTEIRIDEHCISGLYFGKNNVTETGYIHRDYFGTLPGGKSEFNLAIPFERIISVGF